MLLNAIPCTLTWDNCSQREVENCGNALKFFKKKISRRIIRSIIQVPVKILWFTYFWLNGTGF